ncbi:Avidin/streptavidin [Cylindrobasidium torrendii FP15055 ss-10]|uniref:Avidin/streptavidin n=1 Tax=Cylindrobasidium torrendii FP15055 ss-10 TaxID=1314674 RepID=A0A0D7B3A3_9AGAR|nr:Avidin/streptavidin [Cylindrobasidium torrendii FP15055 ss-10]
MHVFSAATLATAISASLNGTWYNQLGSTVEFEASADGTLSGYYTSAVGDAKYEYVLTGRYDTDPRSFDVGATLGWTVNWKNNKAGNSHSTTTWNGQYFSANKQWIRTQWLLARSTTEQRDWASTQTGADIFTREKVAGVAWSPDEMD